MAITLLLLPLSSMARPRNGPISELPDPLQQLVPSCAQECLASTLGSSFPSVACREPDHLKSFCCQYGSVAYALEQLISSCISQDCPSHTSIISESVRKLCSESTASPKSKIPSTTVATSTSASSKAWSIRVLPTVQPSSKTSVGLSSTISNPPSSSVLVSTKTIYTNGIVKATPRVSIQTSDLGSPLPASSETLSDSDDDDDGSLTSAQIAGISMSVVGSVILAIGGICATAYFRRRRIREQANSEGTLDFRSSSKPSFDLNTTLEKAKMPGSLQSLEPVAKFYQPFVPSFDDARPVVSQLPMRPSDIGVAISLETPDVSPAPVHSQKKAQTKFPSSRSSNMSHSTIFEEDRLPALNKKLPEIKSTENPSSATSDQGAITPPFRYADQLSDQRLGPQVPPKPSLSVRIPDADRQKQIPTSVSQDTTAKAQKIDVPRAPQFITASRLVAMLSSKSAADTNPTHSAPSNRSSFDYIPQYYTTPRDQFGGLQESFEYKTPPLIKLNSNSRSSSYEKRDSHVSDTSFETTFADDETPPLKEAKKLSPVVESPISKLQYPKVPRSSNQLVRWHSPSRRYSSEDEDLTRSPDRTPLPAPNYHRGSSKNSSSHSFNVPASGQKSISIQSKVAMSTASDEGWQILDHGRSEPVNQETDYQKQSWKRSKRQLDDSSSQAMELKSPLWDPRLYPLRRGDELFLYLK